MAGLSKLDMKLADWWHRAVDGHNPDPKHINWWVAALLLLPAVAYLLFVSFPWIVLRGALEWLSRRWR